MAKRERLGGVLSLAAAALLTADDALACVEADPAKWAFEAQGCVVSS